jgi:hypothetical protein
MEPTTHDSVPPSSDHHDKPIDLIVRAVRGTVCRMCYQRPHGSERLPNTVARSCEPGCPLFFHLPALYRIAVHHDTGAPGSLELAVKATICSHCHLAPTAGEDCAEFENRTCPLSRFAGEVVTLVETLREWQHANPAVHASERSLGTEESA